MISNMLYLLVWLLSAFTGAHAPSATASMTVPSVHEAVSGTPRAPRAQQALSPGLQSSVGPSVAAEPSLGDVVPPADDAPPAAAMTASYFLVAGYCVGVDEEYSWQLVAAGDPPCAP